jgi:hypothetical protein
MILKRVAVGLLAVAGLLSLTTGVSWSSTSHTTPAHVRCNADWYQNPDETTRKPVQKPGGLEFSDTDLVHHKVYGLTVEHLHPGSYFAFPAPGQPSFFSVEVSGTDGGYATLRWNPSAHKWEMTTGGQFYTAYTPAALVDKVTPHKSHTVVSFGVGFTANPPGTVHTLVRSVVFNHHVYSLGCKPIHPKPRPCVTKTATPLHTTSRERWCKPTYTHSPTPTPTETVPVPTPTETVPPGEAPVPVPVNSDLPVTG